MKAIVMLNGAAGTLAAKAGSQKTADVAAALSMAGIDADIRLIPPARLRAEAESVVKSDADVVIVGGGDGTLSTVAGVLAGTSMPLGILPLGTLNHFAKDLGIPFDLKSAATVIAARNISSVDVGEVNGHVFINNSSLGLYPLMVLDRDAQRRRTGSSKWVAMISAMLKVFHRFPLVHVRLTTDTEKVVRKTPLVFVGNNCYQLDLFHIGSRACLNHGDLSLYVANAQTRWGLVKLTMRAMLGWLEQSRDFEALSLTNCLIESRRALIHVAVDGEVIQLKPPLQYRVRAGALRVCLPENV
jgi:diacylglycerol kinase family enzyme